MRNLLVLILVLLATILFIVLLAFGFSRTEKYECFKWQEESNKYDNYYITEWQKMQCNSHGIKINVPVK